MTSNATPHGPAKRSIKEPYHAHATPATRLAGGNRNRLVQHEIQRQALPPTLNHLNSWLTVTVPAQHSSALRAMHAASPPCFDPPPSAPAPAKTTRGQRKTTQGSVETVQVGEHQLMNPDKMSMQPQSTTSQSSEIKHSRHLIRNATRPRRAAGPPPFGGTPPPLGYHSVSPHYPLVDLNETDPAATDPAARVWSAARPSFFFLSPSTAYRVPPAGALPPFRL